MTEKIRCFFFVYEIEPKIRNCIPCHWATQKTKKKCTKCQKTSKNSGGKTKSKWNDVPTCQVSFALNAHRKDGSLWKRDLIQQSKNVSIACTHFFLMKKKRDGQKNFLCCFCVLQKNLQIWHIFLIMHTFVTTSGHFAGHPQFLTLFSFFPLFFEPAFAWLLYWKHN